jgi:hypothetical protein
MQRYRQTGQQGLLEIAVKIGLGGDSLAARTDQLMALPEIASADPLLYQAP